MQGLAQGFMEMAKYSYKEWYEKDVKSHLDEETKKKILMRISDMTLEHPIWEDRKTNFISQFPELAPYSNSKKITGLQLVAIMETIFREFYSNEVGEV